MSRRSTSTVKGRWGVDIDTCPAELNFVREIIEDSGRVGGMNVARANFLTIVVQAQVRMTYIFPSRKDRLEQQVGQDIV